MEAIDAGDARRLAAIRYPDVEARIWVLASESASHRLRERGARRYFIHAAARRQSLRTSRRITPYYVHSVL